VVSTTIDRCPGLPCQNLVLVVVFRLSVAHFFLSPLLQSVTSSPCRNDWSRLFPWWFIAACIISN